MESNEAYIFADILKKHSTQKPFAIYDKNEKSCQNRTPKSSVNEVILGVAKQMKAIQGADSVNKEVKQRNDLSVYKKSDIIPINMMPLEQPSEHATINLETQCELDTQLFNLMVKAEALIDIPKDVNQEFDTTFNNLVIDAKCSNNNDAIDVKETLNIVDENVKVHETEQIIDLGSTYTKECVNNYPHCKTVDLKNDKSKDSNYITSNIRVLAGSSEMDTVSDNAENKVSINSNRYPNIKPTTLPLVYELELFERFETIVTPLINDNPDFECAKKIINSQIMNRELFIQSHADPVICDRDKSLSPILSIHKKSRLSVKKNIREATNVSYEDEILFSSDEENDYKNNVNELPLTCALATSFYNQQDLNKSMYVGFQTASNKSIQVHTDSYGKAKSIFENVNTFEDVSLTKLVEAIDSSSKNNFKENTMEINYKTNEIVGFKTALENDIKISDEGLVNSKRVFEDILENDKDINIIHNSTKKRKSSLNTSGQAKNDLNAKSRLEEYISDNNLAIDINKKDINEVRHSSVNKHADIVPIDEHIMKEFENNFTPDNIYNDNILKGNNYYKLLNKTDKNKTVDDDNKVVGDEHIFGGFKTASNNEIKISEQGLVKIRNVFEDFNFNDLIVNTNENKENYNKIQDFIQPSTSNNLIGFRTANNNAITVSKQALAKTKHIFDNIEEENIFSTKEHLSDKLPLNINKKEFQSIGNKIKTKNNKHGFINPFSTNKKDEHLLKPKIDINVPYKLSTESTKLNSNCDQKENFIGFQTASNKPVEISKVALAKSERMFKEILCDQSGNELLKENYIDSKNLMKGDSNIAFENIDKNTFNKKTFTETVDHYKQDNKSLINIGFKTASNKPVKISDVALNKSKKIFEDIAHNANEASYNSIINYTNSKSHLMGNTLRGFKTASNKPVAISTEALEKTKDIFRDLEFKDLENNTFKKYESHDNDVKDINLEGFTTANNKSINISAESLSKSKDIVQPIKTVVSQMTHFESNNATTKSIFKGFKTASNKKVEISDEALAKSRKVFQDLIDEKTPSTENESTFVGFQTANNKTVKISEEALTKSKHIFDDIDFKADKVFNVKKTPDNNSVVSKNFGFKTANNNNVCVSEESIKIARKVLESENENCLQKTEEEIHDIENLLNTEVMKNLEESLCTEDFRKDVTPVSKRSGSPILSCPRAKKRKFKTPKNTSRTYEPDKIETLNSVNNSIFCDDYKISKTYSLKNLKDIETNPKGKENSNILNFKLDDMLHVKFDGNRNDIDSDVWSTDKIKKYFTDSVNKKIIPEGWINNHLKLIIWKLLSYEVFFPKSLENICTIKNVLFQLKYRYDRELYNVERPALRKVLEKDEVSSKMMILCVAGFNIDGASGSITNTTQNIELLLTDGWYCVKACADRMIDKLISDGRICVGTKLAIHGAELLNCEQGIDPWEDTSSVRLKIFGNSTRRARWDTRLGFHGNGAILSPLSAVRAEGGKVSRLRVLVTRVYPMLYVEKFEDGSTVTRSERLEHQHQMKYESDRQNQMEKLYDELEKMSDQESQDSEGLDSDKGNLESGSQIYRFIKKNSYSTDFKVNLTEYQTDLLHQHTAKKREKLIENLQRKVQELVKKRGLDAVRNVVPLVKIRIADINNNKISKAMLTIWRPNEYMLDLITEGAWLDIYNVVPTAYRLSEIQISAGRQSMFQKSKINDAKIKIQTDTLKRKCYHIKELQTTTTTDYNEIDTLGFIFLIETTNQFQNVFLADENKNMISINFWGSIKKFGYENIIDTGQIVSCVNLQSRSGNTRKIIPQFRTTEFTYFTKTCKIDAMRKLTEEFTQKFSSINTKTFIEDCVAIKKNFTIVKHGNTATPHRLNNSEYKNRLPVESPLCNNINLTFLDFDSFTEELVSPKTMLRKKKVKEKLDKLKQYGEPPPLNLIHINNSKTIQPYRSPLLKESDVSPNAASIKTTKTPDVAVIENVTENIISSPVLNTTYIKSIKPVKLNFCDNSEDNLKTDPFAEEFDYSPPLSF